MDPSLSMNTVRGSVDLNELDRRTQLYSAQREVLDLKHDLGLLTKAVRHGQPPEGFEPRTADGKAALEEVVRLGELARSLRANSLEAAKEAQRKAARTQEDAFREYWRAHSLVNDSARETQPEGQSAPEMEGAFGAGAAALAQQLRAPGKMFSRVEILAVLRSRKAILEGRQHFDGACRELDALIDIFERME